MSDTAIAGRNPINACIWSGMPFTIMDFWFFPLIIPAIYLCNSLFHLSLIKFPLPLTAKTT